MAIEVRPARPEEMDDFKRVATCSLLMPPEIALPEAVDAVRPEWTLCAFEQGELITSYAWWPLKIRFNGTSCPAAGVTYVGTNPVHRRRGCLRKIISRHFEIMHEEGKQSVAVLHASRASIYHRYGYAVISFQNAYSFEPRNLVFAGPVTGDCGKLRELADGETEVLKDVYRQFCSERTGYIHRARPTWDAGVLAPPPENGALFKIVYEENQIPLGYVIYAVRPEKETRGKLKHQVFIRDFAWLSARACRCLWSHFSGMDLAGEISWLRVPPDDPLPYLVCEPVDLNIQTREGLMARIVDAAGALSGRHYDYEGSICFELKDDLCQWNRGRWRLTAGPGKACVERTERQPEVVLPVDTLAMLLFGQITATRAAEMGRLEVLDPEALRIWDILFQIRHKPFCPDFF